MDLKKLTGMKIRAIADQIGITPQGLYAQIRKDRIEAEYVIPICRISGWKCTPHKLRRDLYPNKEDGMPK